MSKSTLTFSSDTDFPETFDEKIKKEEEVSPWLYTELNNVEKIQVDKADELSDVSGSSDFGNEENNSSNRACACESTERELDEENVFDENTDNKNPDLMPGLFNNLFSDKNNMMQQLFDPKMLNMLKSDEFKEQMSSDNPFNLIQKMLNDQETPTAPEETEETEETKEIEVPELNPSEEIHKVNSFWKNQAEKELAVPRESSIKELSPVNDNVEELTERVARIEVTLDNILYKLDQLADLVKYKK